jgi:hypothetical protein
MDGVVKAESSRSLASEVGRDSGARLDRGPWVRSERRRRPSKGPPVAGCVTPAVWARAWLQGLGLPAPGPGDESICGTLAPGWAAPRFMVARFPCCVG